ncbi:MAG: phosphoglucomutase, alpha-D-glucose phosphate-specific [Candidatus Symbiodolus clandestinus]
MTLCNTFSLPHPRAGQIAESSDCIDIQLLLHHYYHHLPDPNNPQQQVTFGTSGHRGSALLGSFNEHHILAIAQAIAEVRAANHIDGYCFIGRDTHALSEPAFYTLLEVLTANGVTVVIPSDNGFTPTPAISHAILCQNRRGGALADGIIVTPSHNPPQDGGIKYNPPHGGPAEIAMTRMIEQRTNALLKQGLPGIRRCCFSQAKRRGLVLLVDLLEAYVNDLPQVINLVAIQQARPRLAIDPLGGAGIAYWQRIAEQYRLDLTITNPTIDPQFAFMCLDDDGVIRMDCASTAVMQPLLKQRHQFDLCLANDTDHDRHGIITADGLINANHYFSVAADYLFHYRSNWSSKLALGKTVVSSHLVDRVAAQRNRPLVEIPVGFKGFVQGLYQGTLGIAGEESAGATFLRMNGQPWTTDKDGIVSCLLAAEILSVTEENPWQYYQRLLKQLGPISYQRHQCRLNRDQRDRLLTNLTNPLPWPQLAGNPVLEHLTHLPTSEPIGGVKVITQQGWLAIRPSGTEAICKIHCESFVGEQHRTQLEQAALDYLAYLLH